VKEPNHLRRIAIAWLVLSAIATPIVVAVIAPTLPPGNGTSASSGQVFDNTVLLGVVTPIAALMVVYFAYSLVVFRRREEGPQEGVAIHGDSRVHVPWLVLTTIVVLFLAAFGTVELTDAGAGGGEGPSPAFKPSGRAMPVQVIAQQWEFTYRYPTFGGIETARLELPVGRQVEFHVTSLDVIHSFWAPKLGIKADAPRRRQRRLREAGRGRGVRTPLQRALRPLARLHVRHRTGGERRDVPAVDPQPAAGLRAGRQATSEVLDALLPRTG
jgi:Heme/copper-type cytochrome/quinol oxidases, subunit 2